MQYRTISPIRMDGKDIPTGALLDIADSDARQLLEARAIEPACKPFSAKLNPIIQATRG
jgi:hypothetical protein